MERAAQIIHKALPFLRPYTSPTSRDHVRQTYVGALDGRPKPRLGAHKRVRHITLLSAKLMACYLIISMVGGITLSLAYGITIQPKNDPFIELAEHAITGLAESATPGLFMVDALSPLKYIPESVPGAGFQTKARKWRDLQERFRLEPFQKTLQELVNSFTQCLDQSIFTGCCVC